MDYENKKLKEITDYEAMLERKQQTLNETVADMNDNMDHLVKIYSKEKKGVLPFTYTDLDKVPDEQIKPSKVPSYKDMIS